MLFQDRANIIENALLTVCIVNVIYEFLDNFEKNTYLTMVEIIVLGWITYISFHIWERNTVVVISVLKGPLYVVKITVFKRVW